MKDSKKTIRKSISAGASREDMWKVITEDEYTRAWYAEFSEGTYAATDWKEGSKVVFADSTGGGLIGRIRINKEKELLAIEYDGVLKEGLEDYEGEDARAVKGYQEIYTLTEKNGSTLLAIECDMADKYFEFMSQAWDRALQKIKELSEENRAA